MCPVLAVIVILLSSSEVSKGIRLLAKILVVSLEWQSIFSLNLPSGEVFT